MPVTAESEVCVCIALPHVLFSSPSCVIGQQHLCISWAHTLAEVSRFFSLTKIVLCSFPWHAAVQMVSFVCSKKRQLLGVCSHWLIRLRVPIVRDVASSGLHSLLDAVVTGYGDSKMCPPAFPSLDSLCRPCSPVLLMICIRRTS